MLLIIRYNEGYIKRTAAVYLAIHCLPTAAFTGQSSNYEIRVHDQQRMIMSALAATTHTTTHNMSIFVALYYEYSLTV